MDVICRKYKVCAMLSTQRWTSVDELASLSRRKQGFESPRERQSLFVHSDFPSVFDALPKPDGVVWAILFAMCPSSLITASSASAA